MDELVSVIMSVYNETELELNESINSILSQTYRNIEVLIVNDNPKNSDVRTYLKEFKDERIRIVENEKNIGLVKSLNKAIKLSNGNYIARTDEDDVSMPDRLKIQMGYMKEKKLDLVGCCIEFIDERGRKLSTQNFPEEQKKIQFFMKWGNCIPHPTWLVKKSLYEQLGWYREVKRCEDYDFICRAIQKKYRVGNVKQCLLKYRIRNNSISNSNIGEQYILRRYLAKQRKQTVEMQRIEAYLMSSQYKEEVKKYNSFQKAKQHIKKFNGFFEMMKNKYCYILLCEKIGLKIRNLI